MTDELNEQCTDMDCLNEFANACLYVDSIRDLTESKSDLVAMQLNVQSVLSKQEDLNRMLISNDIDICTLSETWLKTITKSCSE